MITMNVLNQLFHNSVEVYEVCGEHGETFRLKDAMDVAIGDVVFDGLSCAWVTGFKNDGQMILSVAPEVSSKLVHELWKKKHFGMLIEN